MNKKHLLIPIIVLLLIIPTITSVVNVQNNSNTVGLSEENQLAVEIDSKKPKTAAGPSYSDLWIDDSDVYGNGSWADIALLYPQWCKDVKGDGTFYLIEDITLTNSDDTGDTLTIGNSSVNFLIKNCTIINGYTRGILLDNVQNGKIYDCDISSTSYGIQLEGSSSNNEIKNSTIDAPSRGIYIIDNSDDNDIINCTLIIQNMMGISLDISDGCTIENNTIIEGEIGIHVQYSHDTVIRNNTIIDFSYYGIFCQLSDNLTLSGNTMQNCGVYFDIINDFDSLNSATIYINNTVNGKPVYYYKNQNGLNTIDFTYAGKPGQVILFNCNYSTVSNLNLSYTSIGIHLLYSSNNVISSNFIKNNHYGMGLYKYCNNNTIFNNTVKNAEYYNIYITSYCKNNTIIENKASNALRGIYLSTENEDNVLSNNRVIDNGYAGISFVNDNKYNKITHNIAIGNGRGISLETYSDHNLLYNNTCNDNVFYGIIIESESNNNTILENNCTETPDSNEQNTGIKLDDCHNTTILDNNIRNNVQSGIYIVQCNDSYITKNDISHNGYSINFLGGIELEDSHHNAIYDNNIQDNEDFGIYLWKSDTNNVSSNEIRNNEGSGIFINSSNDNYIAKNDIIQNGYSGDFKGGIELNNSKYNNITDNSILENDDFGIYLCESDNNNISSNVVRNNRYGIYIDADGASSDNNTFYLNFFKNNTNWHVYFEIGTKGNRLEYNGVGNWWDNYTGPDDIAPYGIGDDPHTWVPEGEEDDFPIVDDDPPVITIIGPSTGKASNNAPDFVVSIQERFIYKMWYTLDNGITNVTFTKNSTIDQTLWKELDPGAVIIRFFVEDKTGKIGTALVVVKKSAAPGAVNASDDDDEDNDDKADSLDVLIIILIVIALITIALITLTGMFVVRKKNMKKNAIERVSSKKFKSNTGAKIKDSDIKSDTPQKHKTTISPKKKEKALTAAATTQTLTEAEKEEVKKTESELGIEKKEFICIVHKGPIKGANIYLCPKCNTFYCVRCAKALKKKGEKCWSCENEIELK